MKMPEKIVATIKPYCFERAKDLLTCLGKKGSGSNAMRLINLIASHFKDFDNGNGNHSLTKTGEIK